MERHEQIDKRLSGVETGVAELRRDMGTNFSELRQEMETNSSQLRQQMYEQFRWIVGIQIIAWISILGTVLALLFRS